MNEFSLIEEIKRIIPKELECELPIGDDAAVMSFLSGSKLVWTADTLVEGIDFLFSHIPKNRKRLGCLSAKNAGRKSLAVNLSDLAAMGASPFACTVSLGIPKHLSQRWVLEFYKGLVAIAKDYQVKIAGGDISASRDFFVSIALLGHSGKRVTKRSGAKAGDWIGVTGSLGGSLAGKHASFQPRINEAKALVNSGISSMIDISDGLLQDLEHLSKSSKLGPLLELTQIPISKQAVHLAGQDPWKSLERACTDGEDFELLFTASPAAKQKIERVMARKFPGVSISWIGKMENRVSVETRFVMAGKPCRFNLRKKGYLHFG